MSAVIVK